MFRAAGLRFYFYLREEGRMHVHVAGARGEAKFWVEPAIELARNNGLDRREVGLAIKLIRDRRNAIRTTWEERFGR